MLEVGGGGLLSQDIDIDDWKKRPRPSSGTGRAISVKASARLRRGGSCASCAAGFCSVSAVLQHRPVLQCALSGADNLSDDSHPDSPAPVMFKY